MSPESSSRPDNGFDLTQAATDGLLAVVVLVLVVGWAMGGGLIAPSDWGDVGTEVALTLAVLVGYFFVRRLGIGYLSLGWAFILLSDVMDVVDEFGLELMWGFKVDTVLRLAGFPLVAVGLSITVSKLRDQLRLTEEVSDDVQRSEERFRHLFEDAPVGYYEADAEGIIQRANQAAHTLLGRAPGTLVDWRVEDLGWTGAEGERRVATLQHPTSGAPGRMRAVLYSHPDGSPRDLELYESPILGTGGSVVGVRVAIMDTTIRNKAEREREELRTHMQQSQRLETIGTLAGGIAHDFNNLLAPILGYVDMALSEVAPGSQVHEDLGQVQTAATRAKDLVRQILQFSRPEKDDTHAVLLQSVVREAAELLRASLPSTIELVRHVDATCPAVMAKGTQIHQVLFNLCTNASHAMPEGGRITVSLDCVDGASEAGWSEDAPGAMVRLRVSDNGSGMDKATVERVFEPFFTTKGSGKGTGLGLSVVHGIVTSFDGSISVQSELGVGTTFSVLLPVAEEVEQKSSRSTGDETVRSEGRILVVDDQEEVLTVTSRVLSRQGFDVTCYDSSEAAVAAFAASPSSFELVLTDQTMPGLTGLELAAEVRRICPDTPVLLTTGYSGSISTDRLQEIGSCELLMKPATADQISRAVSRLLSAQQASPART